MDESLNLVVFSGTDDKLQAVAVLAAGAPIALLDAAFQHVVVRQRHLVELVQDALRLLRAYRRDARHLPADELQAVALDGKTLCGSQQRGAADTHLLSAVSHRLGVTLGQVAVNDKTNEIGAAPDLLADLVIEGRVFTMDALLTQRNIAQYLIDRKGDYIMIVKDNQPTLRDDLAVLFRGPDTPLFIDDQHSTLEKSRGRVEVRTLQTSSALNDYVNWPGVQQVFRLDRKTTILKTDHLRSETVYGLTSLAAGRAGAAPLLKATRGQWTIENRNHWIRDVLFCEDQSQLRAGYLPHVMATLRNVVIGLIHLCHFQCVAHALDFFAAHPLKALTAIGC